MRLIWSRFPICKTKLDIEPRMTVGLPKLIKHKTRLYKNAFRNLQLITNQNSNNFETNLICWLDKQNKSSQREALPVQINTKGISSIIDPLIITQRNMKVRIPLWIVMKKKIQWTQNLVSPVASMSYFFQWAESESN